MRQEQIVAFLGLLLPACAARTTSFTAEEPKLAAAPAPQSSAADVEAEPATAKAAQPVAFAHAVGDYIVRRFSLRSHKAPIVLTERVIALKEHSVVLEVTREAGSDTRSIRVELGSEPTNRGEVLWVAALGNGREIAMGSAAYDAIMRGTAFAADENEGPIESTKIKLDIQGRALDCTETRFRVKVRGRSGTMRTLELENSPWGEVGGDVTTADGAVLYRAEVVDVGREKLRTAAVQEN
jgi:hypothetical protein